MNRTPATSGISSSASSSGAFPLFGALSESPPIGKLLRNQRIAQRVSLEEISQTTRIPLATLRQIERDQFGSMPGDVFVRGFLKSYARAVRLDEEEILARYDDAHGQVEPPTPFAAIAPPERGRRFGIAIAIVILLILFTLALSIVLRPRHRPTQHELSTAWPSPTPSSCEALSTETPTESSRS